MKRALIVAVVLVSSFAFAQQKKPAPMKPAPSPAAPEKKTWSQQAKEGRDLYATLRTSAGDIVLRLYAKDAPNTVENFVALAAGEKEWTHPTTKKVEKKPLYDGVVFHRVIPGYIIQGGDPIGTGFGGPGYVFDNETQSGRQFDKAGLVGMANARPNTNGSQFFITLGPAQHLNGSFTIFGEVISGMDVVKKIAEAPRDPKTDRPEKPVVIKTIAVSDSVTK